MLLLSATPYRTFASRWEEEDDAANVQLFELIEFLGGDEHGQQLRVDAERLFREFGHRLHQIARLEQEPERQLETVEQARQVKGALEALLTRLLSRTERALIVAAEHGPSDHEEPTIPLDASLGPGDIAGYRHLVDSFKAEDKPDAVPYWLSVPLAAQALGPRYQAWKRASHSAGRGVARITQASLAKPQATTDWAHPKLRALRQVVPARTLVTPWVPPSLPWWPLQGAWADATATSPKLLLFGRFRATPQSVAALASLSAEALAISRGDDASAARRRRRFRGRTAQMPVFALFHPSPFLMENVDPLASPGIGLEGILRSVRRQLLDAIKGVLPIRRAKKKERTRNRPIWIVLANIERRLWKDGSATAAWRGVVEAGPMLDQWATAPLLEWISPRELQELAAFAISSPAVACARALRRHLETPFTPADRQELVRLCWTGLRTYFDEPVFYARAPRKESPADTIRRMVLEGCLESALDEHFWMKTRSGQSSASALISDLLDALRLNAGAFTFRSLPNTQQGLRVRCHAAVPFGGTDDESYKEGRGTDATAGAPARADEIREAFNTPFWPHMVATTSVGQEGLDFHIWCDRVAHWDLCPSPVELEQREGRVHRFAGLAVRKKLAAELGAQALKGTQRLQSPWRQLESLSDERFPGGSGMTPWWQLPGAVIHRYVFRLPMSRDIDRFQTLQEQRLIYRLALGQPNSEDLLASLVAASDETRCLLKSLVLNLSAYCRTSKAMAREK
ncbi:MAG: helicase [Ideonella sp. MAG2]|nr:MAG: helicase [Ideonella sp. MAG2]